MDRPEPGLVRWSPNTSCDSFLHINLQHRVVQVYEPTGHAQKGRFDYERLSKHDDFPPLTTYDWSPSHPSLVAVGTATGVVNLLRIDDNSNGYLELNIKMARTCQAVAFNTIGMLAVGLDRVRSDRCLHIWDVNRVYSHPTGFNHDPSQVLEPSQALEPSVSVSSVKFFEDSPQTLVVGIKAQGLRLHDLREPTGAAIQFSTKCNNNLAIDYADQNYFASSALDHPGIMVWDRRATTRPVASRLYQQAVDADDVPWGGALRLDRAIGPDSDPSMSDNKHSFIRSLRYCRDHRGMLAVLSRTGQLKVTDTQREFMSSDQDVNDSPELLEVRRSYEMDHTYADPSRKNDRIVAFDWVTLGSPVLRPRLLVLRANGAFDILEKPSFTSDYLYKLIPWQAPHRGLEEGGRYHDVMRLESSQSNEILGPVLVENAMSDVPIFGPEKADQKCIIREALSGELPEGDLVVDTLASASKLPDVVTSATPVAEKLKALREYKNNDPQKKEGRDVLSKKTASLSASSNAPQTHSQRHEALLGKSMTSQGFPKNAQVVLDHVTLLRAKEKYLFNSAVNSSIIADDPYLRDAWDWIAGAEAAAEDEGMISNPLDMSFMGISSIWLNDLGSRPPSRLSDAAPLPDDNTWERCIGDIVQKRGIPRCKTVNTGRPHHRRLCLDMCGWGRRDLSRVPVADRTSGWHTRAAAQALFHGDTQEAVQVLKKASTEYPELLFVSLALQLIGKGTSDLAKQQLDFDETVASKTDPFLRAISSLIATGDWMGVANLQSLPLRDRIFVAVRNLSDDELTEWLRHEVDQAVAAGDIQGILLTGITDQMVDILARYVDKFHDVQTATLIMSFCAPRYLDDHRCTAWRNAYRAYLQRHKAFFQRVKFEVESTKRSKRGGAPTIKPPSRQIALRCVYCDAEVGLARPGASAGAGASSKQGPSSVAMAGNPLISGAGNTGVCCKNCGRHLPRCVVCLEIVSMPRSDKPEVSIDAEVRLAARFPTFCLKCEHVLHLDHARQWFARHAECPVPECRCRCNFRANPELNYR